jgi:hypothetical protein
MKLFKITSNHLLALIRQIQFNSSIDILNVGNLITLIGISQVPNICSLSVFLLM